MSACTQTELEDGDICFSTNSNRSAFPVPACQHIQSTGLYDKYPAVAQRLGLWQQQQTTVPVLLYTLYNLW